MKILNYNLDNFDALLFDLDGTLINSMPIHNYAWRETFADHGLKIDQALLDETMGMESKRIVAIANERYHKDLNPTLVARHKRDRYLKRLTQVEVVPALMEILEAYHQRKPMAIITGGSHEVVDQLLPLLKIDHYFDAVVCADDTELGKDTPAPYELCCKKINVDPKKCIFFDDGDVGLKGARSANIEVLHVDVASPDIFSHFH